MKAASSTKKKTLVKAFLSAKIVLKEYLKEKIKIYLILKFTFCNVKHSHHSQMPCTKTSHISCRYFVEKVTMILSISRKLLYNYFH